MREIFTLVNRRYSKDLHKIIYANNRIFLPPDHRFRDRQKNQFDGKVENRGPPLILGPDDWLKNYEDAKSKDWKDFFDKVIQSKSQNKL